ncbi:hypothetical protein IWW54_004873, partial [Coemansia sp. RSA 2705]
MCIAFWRLDNQAEASGGYSLVLAFNRDEYFNRPTQGFHIWKDRPYICAPLDLKPSNEAHRGSWIGVNRQGRLAFLTNFREQVPHHQDKISRGALVRDYLLESPVTPGGQRLNTDGSNGSIAMEYAQRVFEEREQYDGFNLVLFDLSLERKGAVYVTNRGNNEDGSRGSMRVLDQGQHMGLSNSTIDSPWPKVVRGTSKFSQTLGELHGFVTSDEQDTHTIAALMGMMRDSAPFAKSGSCVPQRIEDLAQCIFVPRLDGSISQLAEGCYGTRTTDVLLLRKNQLVIAECNYKEDNGRDIDGVAPATVTVPLERQQEIVAAIRAYQKDGVTVPWFDLAHRFKLPQSDMEQIVTLDNDRLQKRREQSARVTQLADRAFDSQRGRCDWDSVVKKLDVPLMECLGRFDASLSSVPVRSLPKFVDWLPDDFPLLKKFVQQLPSTLTSDEWRLVSAFMNVKQADCVMAYSMCIRPRMTTELFELMTRYREKGMPWKDIYQQIPVFASVDGLRRIYSQFKAKESSGLKPATIH